MAPRELLKETPKVQRTIVKTNTTRKPSLLSNATPASTIKKKTISSKKSTEKTPLKVNNTVEPQERQSRKNTPIPKEKHTAMPGSVKKSWKARPKPAHSGVPVPEKMKKLFAELNNKASVKTCNK